MARLYYAASLDVTICPKAASPSCDDGSNQVLNHLTNRTFGQTSLLTVARSAGERLGSKVTRVPIAKTCFGVLLGRMPTNDLGNTGLPSLVWWPPEWSNSLGYQSTSASRRPI